MSTRLATGGRLIDRSERRAFRFNGRHMEGFAGDTLAAALLANDQKLMGRSFKYHRPRGVVASGAEEPNALIGLGEGARFEPNQRATTTELFDGLTAISQNHWPSLAFDVGALNAAMSRFLPAGFYYKTFIHPRAAWKHLFEPVIRKSAGLGKPTEAGDPDRYEHVNVHVDLLIVGGGIAGLQAALVAAETDAKVLVVEQEAHWGGRAPVDGAEIDGAPADDWVKSAVQRLEEASNVTMLNRCMGSGVYDHGYALAYQRCTDHQPGAAGPRHRLWRIRARQIITATGALERPLSFAGNDRPGVMLASAVRDYIINHAVSPGDRCVIVTNNDDAYRTALAVLDAGLTVAAVVDARGKADGELPETCRARGVRIETGKAIAGVALAGNVVKSVDLCAQAGEGAVLETIPCEVVAMSGGWSPVVHLWSHCGGKLKWSEAHSHFHPDADRFPTDDSGKQFVWTAGIASGAMQTPEILKDASAQAERALDLLGLTAQVSTPEASAPKEAPMAPVWVMPQGASRAKKAKMWLDFQNDVKVSDVELAAQEGYRSVEHTKRYTTLGMATDQGKLSNINGLAVLSGALGQPIPQTGTTTFRPPYTPISIGSIAGPHAGEVFQPLRRTPMQGWHDENGADYEPVGHWRRPYCYRRPGESREQAVTREIRNTRDSLGLLDASTLGKILVTGPDAGRFLDMLYTNMMSTLKPGKCRYGLMCSENGFLIDDGVVARLQDGGFLVHTTSGGADHIHAMMEDWLQCEWWDWKVYTANVTEQYAQIAVVGPNARKLLEKLGGMDVSKEALPFMGHADGEISGLPVRVYRISFSGELSYEIAVPANRGLELWEKLVDAGAEWGLMPYGTEALHVMRAEKGFIMIGDETDGTVTPQDLNMHWAISKKKDDYLGKRAQARSHMVDPERWRLVGLETLDGAVLPEGAYALGEGSNENGQRNMIGRVTSTYFSPTLNRGIAMGLVQRGPERMGEVVNFGRTDGSTMEARIVDPVFFDRDGEKQNV